MSVTVDRYTRVRLDLTEPVLQRGAWIYRRAGDQISRNPVVGAPEANQNSNVVLLPGGAWALKTGGVREAGYEDYSDMEIPEEDWDVYSDGIYAQSGVETFLKLAHLALDPAEAIRETALYMWRKKVPAGGDWSIPKLDADEEAFPGPLAPGQGYPLDRFLSSKVTLDANQGFLLMVTAPGDFGVDDILMRAYFGGVTPVTGTTSKVGGQFCLSLIGDGEAILHERNTLNSAMFSSDWTEVMRFQWAEPSKAAGGLHVIGVRPYARNRIAFIVRDPDQIRSAWKTGKAGYHTALFVDAEHISRHVHTGTMTGAGPLRLDIARHYRLPFMIAKGITAETGVLVDEPFSIPLLSAKNQTPMTINGTYFTLDGTGITTVVYDASTHVACTVDSQGRFIPNVGQTQYYVKFGFTANETRTSTPVLLGYEVVIDGSTVSRTGTNQISTAKTVESVSIKGPGTQIEEESATVSLTAIRDLYPILRTRASLKADICVYNGSGTLVSRLFEGVAASTRARKRGTGTDLRAAAWREYDIDMTGLWSRIAEQVPWGGMGPNFGQAYNAPDGPDGNQIQMGWRIIDIIRYLLNSSGFPDTQIDLNETYYGWARLPVQTGVSPDDLYLRPGGEQAYLRMIQRLCTDYLGAILIRDANAGSGGMWRLLPNPQYPYTAIASFVATNPASGYKGTHLGSFGSNTGWIEADTFETWVEPPEFNYLYVTGTGISGPDGKPSHRCEQEVWNWVSHEFYTGQPIAADSTHPDYLGRLVPAYIVDPHLHTQEAVNWVTARTYMFAMHAQKWVRFRGPLLLVTVVGDILQTLARPLRINDVVTIAGATAIIRSCDPEITEKDNLQMAWYEARFV